MKVMSLIKVHSLELIAMSILLLTNIIGLCISNNSIIISVLSLILSIIALSITIISVVRKKECHDEAYIRDEGFAARFSIAVTMLILLCGAIITMFNGKITIRYQHLLILLFIMFIVKDATFIIVEKRGLHGDNKNE